MKARSDMARNVTIHHLKLLHRRQDNQKGLTLFDSIALSITVHRIDIVKCTKNCLKSTLKQLQSDIKYPLQLY